MLNKDRIAITILAVGMIASLWMHFDGSGETELSSEEVWKAIEADFPQNVINVVNQAIQEEQARQQQQQPQAETPTP